MRTFVLATANAHKAEQMRAILEPLGIELVARPVEVGDVEEIEATLEGNALLKAQALSEATGLAALADDTGLFIDALDGRPGVYSARYAGEDATYQSNVVKVLNELEGVAPIERGARFRTVVAAAFPDGTSFAVEGALEGAILLAPVGDGGFGYDPIFAPRGEGGRSLAEMDLADKLAISHRGLALRAFVNRLVE